MQFEPTVREKVMRIKRHYSSGLVTFGEAAMLLTPVLEEVNKQGSRIADEQHRAYHPINAAALIR